MKELSFSGQCIRGPDITVDKIVSLETWPQFSELWRSDRLDNNVDGAAIYGDRKNRQRPIKRTTAGWNGMGSSPPFE